MDAPYIYLFEAAAGSGLLLGAYRLLLERRTSFRICRAYLLAAMVFAAVVPLLKIPVWTPPAVTGIGIGIEVGSPATAVLAGEAPTISWTDMAVAVWVAGIVVLAGGMFRQAVKIGRLRRHARKTPGSGYTIAHTRQPIGAFSFLHTIYLWEKTPPVQQAHIITHEASHIRHGHTCERLFMEGLKALLWWNPFIWIAARKLIEIHEFEADRDVLGQGYAATAYADTIFEQLFGYNPDITNGLHDSLTKKRLQMMTTNTSGRHGLLRLAATLPAIAGLLCAFSFTTRAANATEPHKIDTLKTQEPEQKTTVQNNQQVSVTRNADGTVTITSHSTNRQTGAPANPADTQVSQIRIDAPSGSSESGTGTQIYQFVTVHEQEIAPDDPFLVVEQMPLFQGGNLNNFREWVQGQLKYPATALENRIEGRVIVSFVIEKDGTLSTPTILQTPDDALSKEVLRILSQSPVWTPGEQRGKVVRVKYTLPISFQLPTEQAK